VFEGRSMCLGGTVSVFFGASECLRGGSECMRGDSDCNRGSKC